jgi:hypothetical protein
MTKWSCVIKGILDSPWSRHVQSVHLAIQVHVTKQDGADWLLRKQWGLV